MLKFNKRLSKLLACLALCTAVSVGAIGCSSAKDESKNAKATMVVNNEKISSTVETKIDGDKIFVSLKGTTEYFKGNFKLDGKTATVKIGNDTITVKADSKEATVNSEKLELKENLKSSDGDIYVPIEFLNDSIDARFTYNKEGENLSIKTEMPLKYTKAFSVKYLKGGLKKVVDGDKRTLILVPEGKEVPKEYKNETIIKTPVKKVLLGSTTQGCLLRAIDELPSVCATTSDASTWTIEEIKKGMEDKKIEFVGKSSAPDYEKISTIKPDLAVVYSGPAGETKLIDKLKELKINYVVDNEYLEEDPFGRMEWVKLMSAFYDKEEAAEKYFEDSIKKVETASKSIEGKEKPKVVWASVFKGQVYVPKSDSYVAKMIELAGGDYVFKDKNLKDTKISLEELYNEANKADVFIYSSTKDWNPSLEGIVKKSPILKKLKVVEDKKVWCFHPDYWQSIDKTDELIEDLMKIFVPGSVKGDVRHYIKYDK